jgi:tetratricopeptide (TPR) repeat protein
MNAVLKHNLHDVVSLAALTVSACDRVVQTPAALDNPLDLYSLARIMENTGEWKSAIELYEMALRGGLPDGIAVKATENLAVLARRAGNHGRALALCQELMKNSTFSMVGHEGAAIHYERIAGDAVRALEVVEQGLAHLGDVPDTHRWRLSLTARRERLRQKAIPF